VKPRRLMNLIEAEESERTWCWINGSTRIYIKHKKGFRSFLRENLAIKSVRMNEKDFHMIMVWNNNKEVNQLTKNMQN
jgi:hypothetical protein